MHKNDRKLENKYITMEVMEMKNNTHIILQTFNTHYYYYLLFFSNTYILVYIYSLDIRYIYFQKRFNFMFTRHIYIHYTLTCEFDLTLYSV